MGVIRVNKTLFYPPPTPRTTTASLHDTVPAAMILGAGNAASTRKRRSGGTDGNTAYIQ